MLILYYQNISFPSKGADAAFAAGVAPNGIVQLAQPAVDLRKTVVVGDQRVLFRVGQEAQTADEGGLWDKVDEAYFDLPDDYDFENYEEAAFIRSLSFLTDAEKDALIADYNRLTEIDSRLCELYNYIWGNTGCESGICPL